METVVDKSPSPSVQSRISRFLSSTFSRSDSAVLLLPDGSVQLFPISIRVFGTPLTVADVMRLNPGHDVNSLTSSRKRLLPQKKLRGGSTYYLLPREDNNEGVDRNEVGSSTAAGDQIKLPRSSTFAAPNNSRGARHPVLTRNRSARVEGSSSFSGTPVTRAESPSMPKRPLVITVPESSGSGSTLPSPMAPLTTSKLRRPLVITVPTEDRWQADTCPSPRRSKTPGPYIGTRLPQYDFWPRRTDSATERRPSADRPGQWANPGAHPDLLAFVSPRLPQRPSAFGDSQVLVEEFSRQLRIHQQSFNRLNLQLAIPEAVPEDPGRSMSPRSSRTPGAYLSQVPKGCGFEFCFPTLLPEAGLGYSKMSSLDKERTHEGGWQAVSNADVRPGECLRKSASNKEDVALGRGEDTGGFALQFRSSSVSSSVSLGLKTSEGSSSSSDLDLLSPAIGPGFALLRLD